MKNQDAIKKSIAKRREQTQEAMGQRSIGYAVNWAWRIRFIPMNLKMPLIALASQTNAAGVCEMPVRWVADHCNCQVRHMQKILLELRDLGLITIMDVNPGTVDRSRMFALQITIQPDLWEPPTRKEGNAELPVMRRRDGTVALSTQTFHDHLAKLLQPHPTLFSIYRTVLANIAVLEIAAARGPNARLKLLVAHDETAKAIHGQCHPHILAAASGASGVQIKKIQIVHAIHSPWS